MTEMTYKQKQIQSINEAIDKLDKQYYEEWKQEEAEHVRNALFSKVSVLGDIQAKISIIINNEK